MNNVDALLETGRRLAQQMSSENPELFDQIRQQMGQDGSNDPNNPPNNNNN
jgi:small glutamine-rich tetratricopeptide repeat-containing protein alpha